MYAPTTPGVLYERVDASAAAISPLRMDVTGFAGIAERGPLHLAVPIESWRQFVSWFGGFLGSAHLAYAVRGYFDNGGARCWVVRVAAENAAAAATVIFAAGAGTAVWRVRAHGAGTWGNALDVTLRPTHRAQTTSDPRRSAPAYSAVGSVAGFVRGTHVRVSQDGLSTVKVVSDVDPVRGRLIWVHERPEARLPYDAVLNGFDANRPLLLESVEYTLVVREAQRLVAVHEDLSLIPEHPRFGPRILAPIPAPQDADPAGTLPAAPEPIVLEDVLDTAAGPLTRLVALEAPVDRRPLSGGGDGLALLRVHDFTGSDIDPSLSDEVRRRLQRGIQALEDIEEISLLAVPDVHARPGPTRSYVQPPPRTIDCLPDPCPRPPATRPPEAGELPPAFTDEDVFDVQSAMVAQCERRRDRLAILTAPFSAARDARMGVTAVRAWRRRFDSSYAALYYPWLRIVDPLGDARAVTREIPPCGHVAGQYAQSALAIGVHKAPANVPLRWAEDVTAGIDDATHGVLNEEGIDVIRPLAGRGIRVLGARTIADETSLRFVTVRRLLILIRKSVDAATRWMPFEPNDVATRAKLHLSLSSFLLGLWQQGALRGASAGEAFFVRCDEELNPAEERDRGRLLAVVGVAVTAPLEFVVLRVGRVNDALEVLESPADARGSGGH